jgi:hypothetical protein
MAIVKRQAFDYFVSLGNFRGTSAEYGVRIVLGDTKFKKLVISQKYKEEEGNSATRNNTRSGSTM